MAEIDATLEDLLSVTGASRVTVRQGGARGVFSGNASRNLSGEPK